MFGCDAYSHIPKDERSKFDSKTRKCILVGYGQETKGYRLYSLTQQKVIHSRDVSFCEQAEKPAEGATSDMNPNGDYHLILDLSSTQEPETEPESQVDTQTGSPTVPDEIRRSTRQTRKPDYYGRVECNLSETPTSFREATSSPDESKWKGAMESEMRSLKENKIWDLVDLPPDRKTVGSKWVFKVKTGADGSVVRYKARLVAQGYTQKYGTDYDKTFCPVVRQESLRALFGLSVHYGLKLHQIDVTTAFLNGTLEEEVFMRQPEGFATKGKEHLVCKLN